MADKEDESNMTAEAGEEECSSAAPLHGVAGLARSGDSVVLENTHSASNNCEELTLVVKDTAENTVIPEYFQGSVQEGAVLGQDGQVASGLLSERNVVTTPRIETVTTANFSAVTGELVESLSPITTTIIYVQPDGSFVEGTGLTAEEQRQLVEQLAQQQLVEVTEHEAARLFQQQRPPFIPGGALAPSELQQVIDQVSRSQQSAAQAEPHGVPPPAQRQEPVQAVCEQPPASISLPPGYVLAAGSPTQDAPARTQPLCIVHNASQQLQNVAKQVALQQGQSHNGTRLIHKKQLETIRIQVPIPPPQHEAKLRPVAPLALLQQRAHPTGQTPKVGVSTPQIIHITPVIGQQQYVLANPGEPPIQLLLQRPASLVGGAMQRPASLIGGAIPVLHKVSLQTPVNGKAGRPAPSSGHAPAPAPPTSHGHAPAPAPPASGAPEQKEKQKPRRPQKVQTRSGRVSRPPKHKVKDYKFIKTEDLVDGRQSDSDDYSEISVEEESGEGPAGGGGNPNVAAAANVYLTTKTFKCRSCVKAYIGLGGLTRHYRLNPGHAPPPLGSKTDTPPASAPTAAQTGHCSSASTNQITSNPAEPVPMATPGVALATAPGEKVDLLPLQGALAPGPGKPRGRTGRPRAGAHAGRRGRPGRPPKTLQPPQRRARLKEVLQVCDDEDLMEMVLPRLARVMTLWEFLLMKVLQRVPPD